MEASLDGPVVVAVDGPSGTGKSSVSKAVAKKLGVAYLDTGAMYRALTWWCLRHGVDLSDEATVAERARSLPLEMGLDPEAVTVRVAGHDVEREIRTSGISQVVSRVATNLQVRSELIRRQQQIITDCVRDRGGVVAEGRDVTTVVAPDAPVRVLLVADEKARLLRRSRQLHGRTAGKDAELLEQTRDEVVRRDQDDSQVAQFFDAAPGVQVLDSSRLSFEQTVATLLGLVHAASVQQTEPHHTPQTACETAQEAQ